MPVTPIKPEVSIREVGLRDGLQSLAQTLATADKLAWCDSEYAAGVREMEITAMVPPKLVPQLADAAKVVEHGLTLDGLEVAALIPNLKGAERGIALGVHKLVYVMSASESHNRANVRRSREESLADFRRVVALLNSLPAQNRPMLAGGLSTAMGCTIEGEVSPAEVERLAATLVEAGADELVIADTVGYANPRSVTRLFRRLRQGVGAEKTVAAHFHDTRGLGLANVLAALEVGIRAFDASLCGLGGCPHAPGATGNIVTEDLVFMCESMGLRTGIDLEKLLQTREILARGLPGVELSGHVARAGAGINFRRVV